MKNKSETLPESQKLHILALHGYRQNAEVFRQKTGSFRKMLHKYAKFTYITAPHKVTVICDADDAPITDIGQSTDAGIQKIANIIYYCNWFAMIYRAIRMVF